MINVWWQKDAAVSAFTAHTAEYLFSHNISIYIAQMIRWFRFNTLIAPVPMKQPQMIWLKIYTKSTKKS